MPPLVALVLVGFVFIIALCLTVWAALTMRDQTRRVDPGVARRGARDAQVSYVPMASPGKVASSGPTVWRGGSHASAKVAPPLKPASESAVKPAPTNDEFRGARAVVTPRPVTEDAFERFIENERNDRR